MRTLNVLAWLVLVALGLAAVVVVARLGFVGLALLGLGVWVVCTLFALNDDVPTWGEHVFRARMEGRKQPETDVAFYRWCGIGLLAAGLLGMAVEWLRST